MDADKQAKNCRKKVRYTTWEAANYFGHSGGLRAYPCSVCRGFHLTSQNVKRAHREWQALK